MTLWSTPCRGITLHNLGQRLARFRVLGTSSSAALARVLQSVDSAHADTLLGAQPLPLLPPGYLLAYAAQDPRTATPTTTSEDGKGAKGAKGAKEGSGVARATSGKGEEGAKESRVVVVDSLARAHRR